jgi:hypothetical protein
MNRSILELSILHLAGNALIGWLGYYWLGTGESDSLQLLWSSLLVFLFLTSAVWLHGTALVKFSSDTTLVKAARTALFTVCWRVCGTASIMFRLRSPRFSP